MRVAVVDLGTFSAILLVAESSRGRLTALHEERATVNLAYSTGTTLPETGILRAIRILRQFERRMRKYQIDHAMVVATAAIRHADNRSAIVEKIRASCELPFKVVSARREAEYSAKGALIGLPRIASSAIIIDIGGGSSELIMAKTGVFQGLPIGAAWATRAWGPSAPRSGAQRDLYYLARAEEAVFKIKPQTFSGMSGVVGIGGTITTLAAIKHRMRAFDVDTVHGTALSRDWIESLAAEMSVMTQAALRKMVPFDPARARVLLAGTYLWSGVLNRLNADRVTVSARGLRWGVAAHLAGLPQDTEQAGNDQKTP